MIKALFRTSVAAMLLLSGHVAPAQEIAPGISLPDHGNVWVLDGSGEQKNLVQLKYVPVKLNGHRGANFGRSLAWPVTTKIKQTVEIEGTASTVRLTTDQPVLYLRSIMADDEEAAQSAGPGSKIAILHLLPAKDARVVHTVSFTMITNHPSRESDPIEFISERVAGTPWMRVTVTQPLSPGEYAFTWVPEQANTFSSVVYDFGIGPAQPSPKSTGK